MWGDLGTHVGYGSSWNDENAMVTEIMKNETEGEMYQRQCFSFACAIFRNLLIRGYEVDHKL